MRVNAIKYTKFDYEDGHGRDGEVEDNPYVRGDVVIKPIGTDENETPEIGVVLQVHDSSELRTDMFGNECISELRVPTKEEVIKYRPELALELGFGMVVMKSSKRIKLDVYRKGNDEFLGTRYAPFPVFGNGVELVSNADELNDLVKDVAREYDLFPNDVYFKSDTVK